MTVTSIEDELNRERSLVLDLDSSLLEMETEKMELIHQLKMAKQMAVSLESHLVFLEEQLAADEVNSGEEPSKVFQQEKKAHQRDGAPWKPEKPTLGESKQLVKRVDMETQTEPTEAKPQKEGNWHPKKILIEDDMPNNIAFGRKVYGTKHPEETSTEVDMPKKVVIDVKECGRKRYLGIVTEKLCLASLQALLQELLVHFNV